MRFRGIILGAITVIGVFLIVLSQQNRDTLRKAVVDLEAPEFSLLNRDGTEIKLSQFRGKTVFVHFWASWCKECREEMPAIQALYNRKKDNPDFIFISVIYREDPAKSKQWLDKNKFNIPIYIDRNAKMAKDYGLTGVPETFIIAPGGMLKKRIIGPGQWDKI
ncbi:thiol-disulfide oxidoreductase ResA [bacterium BMS3Abin07]|nr:thiol-disulfide oxidoreductase ResA [bacterium BMS3Abin07]GBE31357.1 thiol-disulfide oxidoreductase ResA [bacterium BMS3Bbin05]HDL19784.1 TlpA family protein disulfide reductase [Nitrospirota bacterium]HDO23272.1 TlpA family protein disulfide reductase [Nitrospirota bacterium]HDZ87808.1 TlpA family protein disulfide reductase [Nitrospirota bacterium]